MLRPRLVVNECYILESRLAEDCFCEIWRATAIYTANRFTLRFLKDDPCLASRLDPFRSSAMRCYRVFDSGVADFVEVELLEGRLFIVSEYNDEVTLSSFSARGSRLGLEDICRIVVDMARGLDAFHGQGIVYGSLDADNVLAHDDRGVPRGIKIQKPGYSVFLPCLLSPGADMGVARRVLAYVAPEARGGSSDDARSDIYSLGVHLVTLLTGSVPVPEDPSRAVDRSVCLDYVAKALARRSVPDAVIAVALRCLRRRPEARFATCLDFIAALRQAVESRRKVMAAMAPRPSVRSLDAMAPGDAASAMRTLDTADYFRSLSESGREEAGLGSQPGFPVDDFADREAVMRMEAVEVDGPEDDGEETVDAIVTRAKASVRNETASRRGADRGFAEDAGEETEAGQPPVTAAAATRGTDEPAATVTPTGPAPEDAGGPAPGTVASTPPPASAMGWSHLTVPPDVVAAEMKQAFERAFKGQGTFKFIEEPRFGNLAGLFAELFSRFKYEGFFVDAGLMRVSAMGMKADVTDFLRCVRASAAKALVGETPGAIRYLRRKVKASDSADALCAPPLDRTLFGCHGEEPDPDFMETPEGIAAVTEAILSLSRTKRPLVLVMRGGEAIDKPLHDLLIGFARKAVSASVCGFVFYSKAEVEPWHVLSGLPY